MSPLRTFSSAIHTSISKEESTNNQQTFSPFIEQQEPESAIQTTCTHKKYPYKKKHGGPPYFPISMVHMPWNIKTIDQRWAFLRLQHKKLTQAEKTEVCSILKSVFEPSKIKQFLKPHTRYRYTTHRIIWLTKSENEPQSTPEQIWSEVFMSHKDDKIENKSRKKCFGEAQIRREDLLKRMSSDYKQLFLQLEQFSITFENYCKLRDHVYTITPRQESHTKLFMFPGVSIVNKLTESHRTKSAHPVFKLAAKAYFQIKQAKTTKSKVLTQKQLSTLHNLKNKLYPSITELEQDASEVCKSSSWYTLKLLLNNAVLKMEQAGVLPMDPNDINDPFAQQTQAIKYAQKADLSSSVTKQCDSNIPQQLASTNPALTCGKKRKCKSSKQPTQKRTKTDLQEPMTRTSTYIDWTKQDMKDAHEETREAAIALMLLSSSTQQ